MNIFPVRVIKDRDTLGSTLELEDMGHIGIRLFIGFRNECRHCQKKYIGLWPREIPNLISALTDIHNRNKEGGIK